MGVNPGGLKNGVIGYIQCDVTQMVTADSSPVASVVKHEIYALRSTTDTRRDNLIR